MNPQVPNSYKNFLPSKNFIKIIGVIAIITILIFTVPKIVTWVISGHSRNSSTSAVVITIPSGDPTTRDSDGDGIPDWEEIAVGLNPLSAETTPGIPDAVAFEKIKSAVGPVNFQTAADNATDSDKVGLALYSDLSQNAIATGSTSDASVVTITQSEITNYIKSAQAKNKTYSNTDLKITTDNNNASIKKYYQDLKKLDTPVLDQNFITHTSSYINGKESKDPYISGVIASLDDMVKKLLITTVPSTAVPIHLDTINALYGIEQTLTNYDPTTNDGLTKFGTVALIEDYYRSAVIANANQIQYFSVILDPKDLK